MVSKLAAVIWKDHQIRRNRYIMTAMEILIPILIFVLQNYVSHSINEPSSESPSQDDNIAQTKYTLPPFKENVCPRDQTDIVFYEPSNKFIDDLMKKAGCYAGYHEKNVKYGKIKKDGKFKYGVRFDGMDDAENNPPKSLSYTIYPVDLVWVNLNDLHSLSGLGLDYTNKDGQLPMMLLKVGIDYAFLSTKDIPVNEEVHLNELKTRDATNEFIAIMFSLGLFCVFAFMIKTVIGNIVAEKASGAKELMLMMGIRRHELWIAKFVDTLFIASPVVAAATFFLDYRIKEHSYVFTQIHPLFVFLFLFYGLLAVIVSFFAASCFFKSETVGSYIPQIVLGIMLMVFVSTVVTEPRSISRGARMAICLIPHLAMTSGFLIFLDFETLGRAVSFTEVLSQTGISMMDVVVLLTIDIFLYTFLTWYLDQIWPGKYGVPQPVWFCFSKKYWSANKVDTTTFVASTSSALVFEPVPPGLVTGVSVDGVVKEYKAFGKGSVKAVNGVTAQFYRGEISSLLGHNGAGKTTLFSIITGLTKPTKGCVLINGYDISTNPEEARKSLGLCPQHDMLFSELTAFQTLKFYGLVKGLACREANFEVNAMFSKLKLKSVASTKGTNLSGGQKRKLSLAIALIGGSEVLVLDEPTSGMDPEIRREIWEMLLALRGSKTILLTTHFMEEADVLSDRIAIMDHGVVQCHGTPMYLKAKLGAGYSLAVVLTPKSSAAKITEMVQEFIPQAVFKSQNGMILYYSLPEQHVAIFPLLLSKLENKVTEGEIRSYSVTVSTLEDVFLKVGEKTKKTQDEPDGKYSRMESDEELSPAKMSKFLLFWNQIYALLVKKCLYFWKNLLLFLLFCAIPIGMILFNYLIGPKLTEKEVKSSLEFSLQLYKPAELFYETSTGVNDAELERVIKEAGTQPRLSKNVLEDLWKLQKQDFQKFLKASTIALGFSPSEINLWFSEEDVHSPPIGMNVLNSAKLRTKEPEGSIKMLVDNSLVSKEILHFLDDKGKCLNLPVMDLVNYNGLFAVFFMLGPIEEHFFNAKDLQLMTTPVYIYWLCHFVFDFLVFLVFIIISTFLFSQVMPDFFEPVNFGDLTGALLLWAIGMILLAYIISSLLRKKMTALSVNLILHVLIAYIAYFLILIVMIIPAMSHEEGQLGSLPWYSYLHITLIFKYGIVWDCLGIKNHYILALALYDLFLAIFLLLWDSKWLGTGLHKILRLCHKPIYDSKSALDRDVKEETNKVSTYITSNSDLSHKPLIAHDLRRWYHSGFCKTNTAVKGVSFALEEGECFGLLGVNGAGKTSTFNMLTGCLPLSGGKAFAGGYSISNPCARQKYLQRIGYCPQFGGIIPCFSGRELLFLFGRLRGVRSRYLEKEVRRLLDSMELNEHATKACGKYSGGNLRKLATAMALIGDPPVVFLDEPTSGVDPAARRSIWNGIHGTRQQGNSVLLTSHSMEECESLCTRLAIMVSGNFRCIGDTVTLKSKYGQGYSVQIKITSNANETDRRTLKMAIADVFGPGCALTDEHYTILQYRIINKTITCPQLFQKLEDLKKRFRELESYSASATTLEQIFISFARDQ